MGPIGYPDSFIHFKNQQKEAMLNALQIIKKINSEFINFDKVNEYRNFGGIRLEDDILVTKTGSEIIGKRIPIEPDEIEEIVGK